MSHIICGTYPGIPHPCLVEVFLPPLANADFRVVTQREHGTRKALLGGLPREGVCQSLILGEPLAYSHSVSCTGNIV